MLSKRFALIVGGTIGGLGAVLSITPPQFGSSGGLSTGSLAGSSLSGATTTPAPAASAVAPAATPAPAASAVAPAATPTTKASTKKKKKTAKATTTTPNSAAATNSANATAATPAPAASTPAAKTAVSGTFTGDAIDTRFGAVQVRITISNGKITNVTAPQYPTESFRDQQINAQAIPWLEQQTIAAQSANIQGVGGASYTSEGFYQSLVSALSKAGM